MRSNASPRQRPAFAAGVAGFGSLSMYANGLALGGGVPACA